MAWLAPAESKRGRQKKGWARSLSSERSEVLCLSVTFPQRHPNLYTVVMTGRPKTASDETLKVLKMWHDRVADLEDQGKWARAQEKETLLRAITEEGMSVATAAKVSGYDRRTITIWLAVFNAEHKSHQKGK